MSDETTEKLRNEILQGYWLDLKPHADREAIFVVSPELDLVEVGSAVVADDISTVTKWISSEELARPTMAQLQAWDQDTTRLFRFLIVAPYVLIQELGH